MNTTRFANQTRLTLTPFGVPALAMAGFSTTLLARMVLPSRKETFIGTPLVCVHGLTAIILGHILPQNRKHRICSITKNEPQDLAHQARNGYPNPERGSQLNADFVNLDDISLRGRYQSDLALADLLLYVPCVFFRRLRIVRRETFNALAIPRCEILSWRLATIASSLSGVMARLFGLRVKVFVQA